MNRYDMYDIYYHNNPYPYHPRHQGSLGFTESNSSYHTIISYYHIISHPIDSTRHSLRSLSLFLMYRR